MSSAVLTGPGMLSTASSLVMPFPKPFTGRSSSSVSFIRRAIQSGCSVDLAIRPPSLLESSPAHVELQCEECLDAHAEGNICMMRALQS